MPQYKYAHSPAQTSAPLDFLSLLQPNQRLLVRSLYLAAVAHPRITKVASLQSYITRQITVRAVRALGESDAAAYADTLNIFRDYKDEAEAYALDVLKAAGIADGGKVGGVK